MGSSSTNWAARVMSGLPPIRDRIADIPDWQLRAITGLMRRSRVPPFDHLVGIRELLGQPCFAEPLHQQLRV